MEKIYHSKSYLKEKLKTKTIRDIAIENEVSPKTIGNLLSKYKLLKSTPDWSGKEIERLKKYYNTSQDIYRLFPNRTQNAVTHKANRLGIKRLQKTSGYGYRINETFFDKWTNNSAYVLGFMCSDGNVFKSCRGFGIHLSKNDIEILESIRRVMKSNHPIAVYKSSVNFRVSNKRLTNALIKYGCIPKKSLVLELPKVPFKYLNHFVRGYFDGDGSIHFNKPNVIKINLLGTRKFLEELQYILYKKLSLTQHRIVDHHSVAFFNYYGDDARNFCLWMYKDSKSLFLKRKHYRFISHMKLRSRNERNKTSYHNKKRPEDGSG